MKKTNQDQRLKLIEDALFGNDKIGELGMVHKVDRMFEVFSGMIFIGKIATWLAVILAGVGAVWEFVVHFLKSPAR